MTRPNISNAIASLLNWNYWQFIMCCFLVFLLLTFLGCNHDKDKPSRVNLAWAEPKTYDPPPNETIGIEFGVNDLVDILASGNLPITVQKQITNTGSEAIPAGYIIQERVVAWSFLVVAGSAAFVEGDLATRTIFECSQPGPTLAPGETRTIQFVLGGPDCPAIGGLVILPCGMYKETLTADSNYGIKEINEHDNDAGHFFFVPSPALAINIKVDRNPDNIPNVNVVGQTVQIITPASTFQPGDVITTHTFTINIVPTGVMDYTVNGRTPVVGSLAGTTGELIPAPPLINPATLDYNVTIPDPSFFGPCNSFYQTFQVYEEKVNTKITAISQDGCIIAQKSALVSVIYECDPD